MSIIFRYCSDLHLEFSDFEDNRLFEINKEPENKYYLALLGDIGYPNSERLREFLKKISEIYDKVFYIPGNHEYYNKRITYLENKNLLTQLCENTNIILLDNASYIDGSYKFIGTTLWSKIPQKSKGYMETHINDYRYILDENNRPVTINHTNKFNEEAIKFVYSELDFNYKCILLTHHAPLFSNKDTLQFTAHPKYLAGPNNYAFHNDLIDIICSPIIAWFYGHTHYVSKFVLNNVIIATNQKGYYDECKDFDPTLHIDFPI